MAGRKNNKQLRFDMFEGQKVNTFRSVLSRLEVRDGVAKDKPHPQGSEVFFLVRGYVGPVTIDDGDEGKERIETVKLVDKVELPRASGREVFEEWERVALEQQTALDMEIPDALPENFGEESND